jgi:4-amino-4-deoxy-L-arabinose transferase-like glycosyltransferase
VRFWAGCLLLLALMATVQVSSIRDETQTFDEGVHLAAGYSYWKGGEFRLNVEHPPFVKLLASAPLLFMRLDVPFDHVGWTRPDQLEFAWEFLFHNRIPQDELILAGRLTVIVLNLLLASAIAWWTRARFGAVAALFALVLLIFDPNLIAHGRYVTTDVAVAGCYFLACALWCDWIERSDWRALFGAGLATGVALACKFSAVVLLGALPMISVLHVVYAGWNRRAAVRYAAGWVAVLGMSGVILGSMYAPETIRLVQGNYPRVGRGPLSALPAHPWIWGFTEVLQHNSEGHESYLLGERRRTGWWHYFPVAIAVKSTIGSLALLVFAAILALRARPPSFTWTALCLAAGVFLLVALTSQINLGLRHILPVYVILYVGAAVMVTFWARKQKWVGAVALVLLAAHAVESAAAYPNYVSFFNVAAGGSESGARYLVDSNLDWGQDGHRLKRYVDAAATENTCIAWFGSAPLSYLGIPEHPLPTTEDVARSGPPKCLAIVSATLLKGLYVGDRYSWLRTLSPSARVGDSIYVYDLREPAR